MNRPKLLDLFCGAGGAAVGYHRAGFDVIGVDITPHPEFPFELIVGDAMAILSDLWFLDQFQAIHASPPCPRYSSITPDSSRDSHPDLLAPVTAQLQAWGGTYAIENVVGAPMAGPVLICAQAMGLRELKRHRLFTSNVHLMSPGCACSSGPAYGIYGDHGDKTPRQRNDGYRRWGKARDVAHAQQLMGIDWMTSWDDLADAIPPAYTEYVGAQLLAHLTAERAA